MDRLKDKICVVTAAGQGIGRASALAMFEEGAHVVATDINAEALEELKGHGLETALLDVRDGAAITAFRDRVGGADVLFNCAGFVEHGTILDCDAAKWAFSFDLNVTAMYRMIRAFLPGMIAKGSGSIINMASVAGSVVAVPNRFVYGASKAAVIGMTKALAADFTTKGIRVNAICPGTVDSPSLMERLKATGDFEAAKAAFISRQPMGRMARADEIGMLVVYLASDEAAFVTGQTFVIDGGWSL